MGTESILGIYVAIGFFFAVGASIFSGHKRIPFTAFLTIVLLWAYFVPRAIGRLIKEKRENETH